jgi:DAACS family dicarboxylate/amino acid:cation (Na+ or H+) symporter
VLVLVSLGMNPALIAIILGVDRILDMCRTTLNVTGDITAATYIARSEGYPLMGELRPPQRTPTTPSTDLISAAES